MHFITYGQSTASHDDMANKTSAVQTGKFQAVTHKTYKPNCSVRALNSVYQIEKRLNVKEESFF